VRREGHIVLKLSDAAETRAPAHLDVLAGARRPSGRVDGGGRVDRTVLARVTGLRAKRIYHSARRIGRVGDRTAAYDDLEHALGLPRALSIQLAEPERADEVVAELRALDLIEWAMVEPLAAAPFALDRTAGAAEGAGVSHAAFEMVGGLRALSIEPGSIDTPVAVIDTGVALEHPEFAGRLHAGIDTVDLGMGRLADGVYLVGDSLGMDFCARDETGHGSHCAGVIGALGLGLPRGLAGAAPVIPVRALAAAQVGAGDLVGVGGLTDIDAAIKAACDLGAKVLNMSFGTPEDALDRHAPPPHADVVAYAVARGVIPVAAMGNSGKREAFYPAALPETIAVASVALDGRHSEFSTTGLHVALSAPGEAVLSAGLSGYRESTGTSHAAPYVAAAAALIAARARRRGHDLSPAEAKSILTRGARATQGGHSEQTGHGILDVPAALNLVDAENFGAENFGNGGVHG